MSVKSSSRSPSVGVAWLWSSHVFVKYEILYVHGNNLQKSFSRLTYVSSVSHVYY